MNIVKPLQAGLLHKTFAYQGQSIFAVSMLWGFRLDSGEPMLEPDLWEAIAGLLGSGQIFDAGMPKAKAEVLACASFFAPGARPVTVGQTRLRLGAVDKQLMVHGDRVWRTLGADSPRPFVEMPLGYAHAYGGEGFERNPIGKGFVPVQGEDGEERPLPNVEYPKKLVVSPSEQPPPASYAPMDMMWEQRLAKAGTYDEAYIKTRMPGLPDDIDWAYFNAAAPDQWVDGYFQGDEAFELHNMHPDLPRQAGKLPDVVGRCFVNQALGEQDVFKEIKTRLDTVWFFPAANLGVLIHRGTTLVAESDGKDIKQLLLAYENRRDTPRSKEHYQHQLVLRTDPEEGFKYSLFSPPLIPVGCRCGFEILVERDDFPLEMLRKANSDTYADEKQRVAAEELARHKQDAMMQLEAAGVDSKAFLAQFEAPAQESPEAKKLKELMEKVAPGITTDPKSIDITQLNLKAMDDITAYTNALAAEKRAQAGQLLDEQLATLKQASDSPEVADALVRLEEAVAEAKLPPVLPRLNLDAQYAQLQQQASDLDQHLSALREQGVSDETYDKLKIDTEACRQQFEHAEASMKASYRQGAHFVDEGRSPHGGQEAAILAALLLAYQSGAGTAGGDYAYVDFSGQDLTGIDLSNAYLEYADFTDADLSGADLRGAIMAHAQFVNTRLAGAKLQDANLGACLIENADFLDADLTGATLAKSTIRASRFHRCNITGRMGAFLETVFERADFTASVLAGNDFIEADISHCVFAGADLSKASFLSPVMRHANFDRAILTGVNFVGALAGHASFKNASMFNVRFVKGCELTNCLFSGADASEGNFRDNDLRSADFSHATLRKTDFSDADLSQAKLNACEAYQAQFMGSNLQGATMQGINLMEGSLHKARLQGANLRNANLYSVSFLDATLGHTDFGGAYLEKTILRDWRPELE